MLRDLDATIKRLSLIRTERQNIYSSVGHTFLPTHPRLFSSSKLWPLGFHRAVFQSLTSQQAIKEKNNSIKAQHGSAILRRPNILYLYKAAATKGKGSGRESISENLACLSPLFSLASGNSQLGSLLLTQMRSRGEGGLEALSNVAGRARRRWINLPWRWQALGSVSSTVGSPAVFITSALLWFTLKYYDCLIAGLLASAAGQMAFHELPAWHSLGGCLPAQALNRDKEQPLGRATPVT